MAIVNYQSRDERTQALYEVTSRDARKIEKRILRPEIEGDGSDRELALILHYSWRAELYGERLEVGWGKVERQALEWLTEQTECPDDLADQIRDDLAGLYLEVAQ